MLPASVNGDTWIRTPGNIFAMRRKSEKCFGDESFFIIGKNSFVVFMGLSSWWIKLDVAFITN